MNPLTTVAATLALQFLLLILALSHATVTKLPSGWWLDLWGWRVGRWT